MTISSLHSRSSAMMLSTTQRPQPSKIANELFTQLDSTGKGYIEKSDVENALNKLPKAGNSGSLTPSSKTEAEALFVKMDSNGNGKLTKEEMSAAVQKIAAELDGQSPRMRLQGDAPPPPPPKPEGAINSTVNSASKSSNNPMDSNGDGTVSDAERLAYERSHRISLENVEVQSTVSSKDNTAVFSKHSTEAQLMNRMMQVLQAYSSSNQTMEHSGFSATI